MFSKASNVTSALTLLPFLFVSLKEAGTGKATYWSVIVYTKTIINQCNLRAKIKPMQDSN